MDPSEYHNVARLQDRHWWYRGMAAISLALLGRAVDPGPVRVLDAGCGPGGLLKRLARFGPPVGVDLHPLALTLARGPFPLAQASVAHLPFASHSFDVVASMDVLYHTAVADDVAALREFARVLRRPGNPPHKRGGLLLIRVPALEALRSGHDRVVHTRQRYSAAELGAKLRAAGFVVDRLTYANTLLFVPILLWRALPGPAAASANGLSDVELPPAVVNRALEAVLQLEAWWLARFNLPIGVSLIALAHT